MCGAVVHDPPFVRPVPPLFVRSLVAALRCTVCARCRSFGSCWTALHRGALLSASRCEAMSSGLAAEPARLQLTGEALEDQHDASGSRETARHFDPLTPPCCYPLIQTTDTRATMHTPSQQLAFAAFTPAFSTPAHFAAAAAGIGFTPMQTTQQPQQQQQPKTGANYSQGLGFDSSPFGSTLFPTPAARAVVPHLPSAVDALADAGLSRSARMLAEIALTFHSAGAEAAMNGLNPTFAPYKPGQAEVNIMPPPASMALVGKCCLLQGEFRRSIQYTKTALAELQKLRRLPQHAIPLGMQPLLASPEMEWTLQLVDGHLGCRDDAQAQKLLEQLYNATQASAVAALAAGQSQPSLPIKYLLILARMYSAPILPTSPSMPQPYLTHNPRAAIDIHTRILQQYPLALESAVELIRLNHDPRPIMAAVWHTAAGNAGAASVASFKAQSLLLYVFLTAQWNAQQQKAQEALQSEEGGFNWLVSIAPRSAHMLEQRVWLQSQCLDSDTVMRSLHSMHAIDPFILSCCELLAMYYHRRNHNKELASLMAHCMRIDDTRSETWQVAALHADSNGQRDKCMRYFEKALQLSASALNDCTRPLPSPMVLAMPHFLRGHQLLAAESAAFQEALATNEAAAARGEQTQTIAASTAFEHCLASFRKAQSFAPRSLLVQEGMSQAYLLHAKIGLTQGQNAGSSLNNHSSYKMALNTLLAETNLPVNKSNARAKALFGIFLSYCPEGRQKAAKVLHQALQLDGEYSEAVLALSDMYVASNQFGDALNMLLPFLAKATPLQAYSLGLPHSPLGSRDYFLVKVGRVYAAQGDLAKALVYYRQALAVNPNCKQAQEAMAKVEAEAQGQQHTAQRHDLACLLCDRSLLMLFLCSLCAVDALDPEAEED